MGKSLQSAGKLQELSRFASKSQRPKQTQPTSAAVAVAKAASTIKLDLPKKVSVREREGDEQQCRRTPLATVVGDCAKRWFHETHKEAKAGNPSMQVLLGQMYYTGYGVPRNPKKGFSWISRVSKIRSSVWKVGEKQPGYHASDSDSCELENKA